MSVYIVVEDCVKCSRSFRNEEKQHFEEKGKKGIEDSAECLIKLNILEWT